MGCLTGLVGCVGGGVIVDTDDYILYYTHSIMLIRQGFSLSSRSHSLRLCGAFSNNKQMSAYK